MKSHAQISTILLVLLLTLSACAPQATAVPFTETPLPAPTATPLPPTATPLPPLLMVGGDVPCYAGPGPDYESLATLVIGMKVEVLSKDSTGEYWIVQSPAGNGQCWTESRYATILGPSDGIPVLAADAVPTLYVAIPGIPDKFKIELSCAPTGSEPGAYWVNHKTGQAVLVSMGWLDSKNETGYRIYKDGLVLVELSAGVLEYQDSITLEKGTPTSFTYSLTAFNEEGESQKVELQVSTTNVCKGN